MFSGLTSFGFCVGGYKFTVEREGKGKLAKAYLTTEKGLEVIEQREYRGSSAFGVALRDGMNWLERMQDQL